MSTQTSSSIEEHEGFTAAEREAMTQRATETRPSRTRTSAAEKATAAARAVQDKIEQMAPEDRNLAREVHRLVTEAAPQLAPKLWYGMPAYALDGKIVCHFQDGPMWPTSYALTEITDQVGAEIAALVRRAVA